jgi:hypothetical protein
VAAPPGPGRVGAAWAASPRSCGAATAASAAWGYATRRDEARGPTAAAALWATERGFGDYAAWRAHLGGAIYGGGGVVGSGLATIGLSYRLDVLRYVPYAAVGVGVLVRGGGPFAAGVEPALEIGGGVDVLRGRARSWGVAAAITSFASDTTRSPSRSARPGGGATSDPRGARRGDQRLWRSTRARVKIRSGVPRKP